MDPKLVKFSLVLVPILTNYTLNYLKLHYYTILVYQPSNLIILARATPHTRALHLSLYHVIVVASPLPRKARQSRRVANRYEEMARMRMSMRSCMIWVRKMCSNDDGGVDWIEMPQGGGQGTMRWCRSS